MLVLLYYLSQNADFSDSVKPLMEKLKDSQQMLNFLKDLSKFTQTFSSFHPQDKKQDGDSAPSSTASSPPPPPHKEEKDEKNPQSPTQGIADEFIQNILESYLKKHN